jgi:glycosyltransferase involved in cell wall biosynthesis
MTVSIFIQTLNEEQNLPSCLDSVAWSDDIVVLDSISKDQTEEICRQRGVRFFQRPYDGRGPHQNWAMENIDFKHEWVFYLDADEHMTPELREEICAIARSPGERRVAFFCGRKNMFRGRWLKHSMPPGYIMRFFKPRHIRFERLVNPTPIIDGPHGYLKNHFIHYNFSKGITEWLQRHNRYSTYEAVEQIRALRERPVEWSRAFFSKDANTRRLEAKNISFRMPFRPALKFILLYFLKMGFLDGRPGLTYCVLQAVYEYQICLKMEEIRRAERGDAPS